MTAASVSGITILDNANSISGGTLISGGTSPTAPSNRSIAGLYTTQSAGWYVAKRQNISNASGRYVGKRFTFGSAQNLTGKLITFACNTGARKESFSRIFSELDEPPSFLTNDFYQYTLAVAFQSLVAGNVIGVGFYKVPNNTDANKPFALFNSTGTLLANGTFTAETLTGWQYGFFSSPYTISANTTYLVCYRCSLPQTLVAGTYEAASYIFDSNFFSADYFTNPFVKALNNATFTNGRFFQGSNTNPFPNSSYQSSNYWVDVLFQPSGVTDNYINLNKFANRPNGLIVRLYSGGSTTTNYVQANIATNQNNATPTYDTPYELNTGIGDWSVHVLDPSLAGLTTAGTFDIANVTSIEFRSTYYGESSQAVYINKICSTPKLTVTGGTSPDSACTFADFVSYQSSSSIQTWFAAKTGSQYFFILPLQIGDATNAVRFVQSDFSLVWHGKESSSANPWRYLFGDSVLGLDLNLKSGDIVTLTRGQFASTSKVHWNITGSGATVTLTDCIMPLIGTNTFNVGALDGCIFSGCDRLTLNGATFTSCTIQNSTDATGALYWQSTSSTINGCSLTGNTAAIAVVLSGDRTINLSALTFSSNTNDWIVTGTGTLTIVVDTATTTDKSWANTSGGSTANGVNASGLTGSVVFQVPVTSYVRSVTGVPTGSSLLLAVRSSNGVANTSQFTLASGNNSGNGTLVISGSIPLDTPASGYVRAARNNGTEDRLAYTSWSGSTFTLSGTLPATYSAGNGAYVGYLDVINSATSTISASLQYVSDRNVVLTIRKGSGTGKFKDYQTNYTLTNQDSVIPFTSIADSVNTS